MDIMVSTVYVVFPVFLVVGLGFCLKFTGLVGPEFLYNLNRLIYYVALPAMLFYKIATSDFTASFNSTLLAGLLISTILTYALSYGYAVIRGYTPEVIGAFCQGAFRGNLAYVGLPIILYGYGEQGFATAGILLGFTVPISNLMGVFSLILPQREKQHSLGTAFWAYQFAFNPLIVASLIGIAWSLFTLPVPVIIGRSLHILSGLALPLALISIGASFSPDKIKGDMIKAGISTGLKLVIMPVITGIILIMLGVGGEDLAVGVILAGCPTATVAYIMAQQLDSDAELSGAIIMLSTAFSVISYSVMLYILKARFG